MIQSLLPPPPRSPDSTKPTRRPSPDSLEPPPKRPALDENPYPAAAGGDGLRLLGLLLQCAEAVSLDNLKEAADLLPELAELSSPLRVLAGTRRGLLLGGSPVTHRLVRP